MCSRHHLRKTAPVGGSAGGSELDKKRCGWAGDDPLYVAYHDDEWGVPVWDDRLQFEFLTLEGAQAGLSWSTILNKREGYRENFAGFDPAKVARFTSKRIDKILKDPAMAGFGRNRAKARRDPLRR